MWIPVSRVELLYSGWLKVRYLPRRGTKGSKVRVLLRSFLSPLLSADLQFMSFHSASLGFMMEWGEELKE